MADALRNGAQAFALLGDALRCQAELDYEAVCALPAMPGGDIANYSAMDARVLASIQAGLQHPDPAHRQGYLRGLTWVLSCLASDSIPREADELVADVVESFSCSTGGAHV